MSAVAARAQPNPALCSKAEDKCVYVQELICNLEKAICEYSETDKQWLSKILSKDDPCFGTLLQLIIEPKYESFQRLRCVTLKAVQLMIRVALQWHPISGDALNAGMEHLVILTDQQRAAQLVGQLKKITERCQEPLVVCDAVLLTAELGRDHFDVGLVSRYLELFVQLPERADELVEVALRLHAWGGSWRAEVLTGIVSREGGKLLCEVLLQLINRGDEMRRLRSLKVLAGALGRPSGDSLLYTNDVCVLVEIIIRDMPNHAEEEKNFAAYATLYRVLLQRCAVARTHYRDEAVTLLHELSTDEGLCESVRSKSREVLSLLDIRRES